MTEEHPGPTVKPKKKSGPKPLSEAERAARKEARRQSQNRGRKARYEANKKEELAKRAEYRKANKTKLIENDKRYRERNKEKIRARDKKYREANKDKRRECCRNYHEQNRDALRVKKKVYHVNKIRNDPAYHMLVVVRSRTHGLLRDIIEVTPRKPSSFLKYFGCTKEDLISHLESLMKEGMSWENYGSIWHLDHIVPIRLAAKNHEMLLKLNHFKNLQPLFVQENIDKGGTIPEVWPEGVPFTREDFGLSPPRSTPFP